MQNINLESVALPTSSTRVFKDDCMFSFDTAYDTQGLDICMKCHQAFSRGEFKYTQMHSEFYDHDVFLNYRKIRKVQKKEEQPLKMMKLEVKQSSEDDLFDTKCAIYCAKSDTTIDYPNADLPLKLTLVADAIIQATSFEKKEEIMAWEQEIKTCKHSTSVKQECISNLQLKQCSSCELTENLWICLHCGNLGCGRSQFGGVPGHSHAMEHQKGHPEHAIAVKLGSLSSDIADCYCYACDEEVKVPDLANLLKTFGIDISSFVRTEKSLTELQIEQNIQWDFKMAGDGNQECKPIFGPGLTGFKNLGNSCYLASVLQVLFSIKEFQDAYFNPDGIPLDKILGNLKPYEDLETQLFKLGDGLLSGRYSVPDENTTEAAKYQRGIKPSGFKSLIGEGHVEFSTMLQQDAFEFWSYLIDKLERKKIYGNFENSPTDILKFVTETKMKCEKCGGVKFQREITNSLSIPLSIEHIDTDSEGNKSFKETTIEESLKNWNSPETLQYECSGCRSVEKFTRSEAIKSMPKILTLNPQRIVLDNWVPTKVSVPIKFQERLNLFSCQSEGTLDNEFELPCAEESDSEKQPEFKFDETALNNLFEMGFTENRAKHALYATGNTGAEPAMNWLFGHMDDTSIDLPFALPDSGSKPKNPLDNIDQGQVENLTSMGFSATLAMKGLYLNNNNAEAAVEWLFNNPNDDGVIDIEESDVGNVENEQQLIEKLLADGVSTEYDLLGVICHKGTSVHSGHYVAFIKKMVDGKRKWVLFNDEKVVIAIPENIKEIEKSGYMYIYQRIDEN